MTARSTYESTVKATGPTQTASLGANELTRQTSCDAQLSVVGLVLQNGNAAYVTAVANANKAKYAADLAAEVAKQAAQMVARDTLRATGDTGPV
jgi:hypothetical protein